MLYPNSTSNLKPGSKVKFSADIVAAPTEGVEGM
jgi:hypothetical protein